MGQVYLAEDTTLNRRVALKVLPPAVAEDPERLARFEREAKALAALNHPNIVTVHSVEQAGSVHFITMELVGGKTLTKMLPRNGFSLRELLEIAIPLADAVSSAHRSGITHRDLKPDNIMFDDEGRLRVLDFGLAKACDPDVSKDGGTQAPTATVETEEGRVLGTVAYMSPEQAEGKPIDSRTDIFSLGTILHEMATGERPFRGDTSMSIISSILRDDPAPITEFKRSLPRDLGRIVRRCLAKEPDRRYQTALDLRNELEELKAEIDSGQTTVGAGTTVQRSITGRYVLGLFLALVAVVIGAVLVLRPWKGPGSPEVEYITRPITSTMEWEVSPSWSPEGEFIAYARRDSGNLDVVVQPVAGGEAVVRAGGAGDEFSPHWSPDGRYLAYISSSVPGSWVYLVPPHGGSPRKLIDTNIPALDTDTFLQVMGDRPWSQDARTLLVSRTTALGRLAVFRVDRDHGHAEQLTYPPAGSDDFSASYSFNGQNIVFQRRIRGVGTLWTVPSAGGEPSQIQMEGFDIVAPAWRPDNRRVVFRSGQYGGVANLWEIDVITGETSQITFETNEIYSFAISPDDKIAYSPFWHDTFLFIVDAGTGERQQITSHTKDNFGARFSPNGSSVAYHSTRTGDGEIWLHHLDGRPETRITDHPGWDLYPDWSPDGRQLIFVSNREGPFKIFISNADGGDVRRLVDQPISVRSPQPVNASLVGRWSPDGELIAYMVDGDETSDLWTVRADGTGARQVLSDVSGFDWYLDGRRGVAMRQAGSEHQLVAVNLETGEERPLFLGPMIEIDVAPDGSAVAFCHGRGHLGMGLARLHLEPGIGPDSLPLAIGEPEYVVAVEDLWHVHNGGWSADAKNVVYTRDTDYADIYVLLQKR